MSSVTITLTLAKDVYEKLLAAARDAGQGKKDFINETIRDYVAAAGALIPAGADKNNGAVTVTFTQDIPDGLWTKIMAACARQSTPARKVIGSQLVAHAIAQRVTPPKPPSQQDFSKVSQRQDRLRRHAGDARRRYGL